MRLLYLVSHPIQYQAPLLRRIAAEPGIALRVVFGHLATAKTHREPEFGLDVDWDVPLLDGYDSVALAGTDIAKEIDAADVIWIHGWQYPWQRTALTTAWRKGVPVLMRGENWSGAMPDAAAPVGWARRLWRRRLFSLVSGFLAIGSRNRDYYAAHGVPGEKLFSMPYAVDNGFFEARAQAAEPRRDALRDELRMPPGRRVILFAGKLMPRKCPDLLVEAWQAASWGEERPVLLFVGDGELHGELRRAAPEAVFAGFRNQSELAAFYDLADLLVVPSRREPWGLVVNEAMASGTGVVASDEVGAAYDLIGPDTGGMFHAGDADDLAATLVRCLPHSDALGAAARRRITGWDFEANVSGLKTALAAVAR